ncbi:MAG: hypothetical protein IPK19_36535 [Chloroflexi bacterium]|nr:hypothetical protein [Chloroflexota bacterium]
MPITFERVPGEPILIVSTVGGLTVEGMHEIFARSAQIQREIGDILYRITDNTLLDIGAQDFINIIQLAQTAGRDLPGSSADPNIRAVLVASNRWTLLFREALSQPQFGGVFLPVFETRQSALAYVHLQLAKLQDEATA